MNDVSTTHNTITPITISNTTTTTKNNNKLSTTDDKFKLLHGILKKPIIFSILNDYQSSIVMLLPPTPQYGYMSKIPANIGVICSFEPFINILTKQPPTTTSIYPQTSTTLSQFLTSISSMSPSSSHYELFQSVSTLLSTSSTSSASSPSSLSSSATATASSSSPSFPTPQQPSSAFSSHFTMHSSQLPPLELVLSWISHLFPLHNQSLPIQQQQLFTQNSLIPAQYTFSVSITPTKNHTAAIDLLYTHNPPFCANNTNNTNNNDNIVSEKDITEKDIELLINQVSTQEYIQTLCLAGMVLFGITRQLHIIVLWITQAIRQYLSSKL